MVHEPGNGDVEESEDRQRPFTSGAASEIVVVGIDLGTSGVRAVAFNRNLTSLAEERRSYKVRVRPGGGVEQNPLDVAEAAEECIAAVAVRLKGIAKISALCLAGTVSSLALFGPPHPAAGRQFEYSPLTPASLWGDARSAAEAEEIRGRFGLSAYRRTGCPAHASYWPAKLLWWRRHGMDRFLKDSLAYAGEGDAALQPFQQQGAEKIILAGLKDFVLYRLTGEWAVDSSMATATGLYDPVANEWDRELLTWLEVPPERLPSIHAPTEKLTVASHVADRLVLPHGIPVVIGASDGVLSHLGLGCIKAGLGSCMIGTSGAVRLSSGQREIDSKARTWAYPLINGLWVLGGAVNNGGNILSWFSDLVNGTIQAISRGHSEQSPAQLSSALVKPYGLMRLGFQANPGADGLLFVPYVHGERSPLWREDLRGAFIGLSPTHGPAELARALLEGISLGLYSVFRVLVEQAGQPLELRASGGFLKSNEWIQLQANVFNVPVAITNQGQETAAGAAMLAWQSVHGVPVSDMARRITVVRQFRPEENEHARYEEIFGRMETLRELIWPKPENPPKQDPEQHAIIQ